MESIIERWTEGPLEYGVLPSGRTVAVKRLFERIEILDKNFESEVACLVGVKHKNTVRFLGYCSETQHVMMPYEGKLVWADARQRLLCFEYLPKGCLADYLSDASCQLQWTRCYQIIKGICEGVHYLHRQRIIHMDLKPQNVLLDDNMVPKVADFGLSRRLSESQSQAITENKLGTMGYMAPEFINNGEITFKTDIYSLGVIIMKILMGRKECSDVKEVVESWTGKFGTSKIQTAMEQVKLCVEIGIKCTNNVPANRPSTLFTICKILGEEEISNCSTTSDVATSTEGQINFTSKLANELKLMDDSVAPSQLQDDGKMGGFTEMRYIKNEKSESMFSEFLGRLAAELGLPYPEIRGQRLPGAVPGAMSTWIIEAKVRERPVAPRVNDIVFTRPYCNWGIGLEQALQEALARALWVYREEIPEDSPFRHFGRRNENGMPLARANREGMTLCTAQMEHLESHIKNLEELMVDTMRVNNTLEVMKNTVMKENKKLKCEKQNLKDETQDLKEKIHFKDVLLLAKDTQIATLMKKVHMLEKQLEPPVPIPAVEAKEEPMEKIPVHSDGQEEWLIRKEALLGKTLAVARGFVISVARVGALLLRRYS